MRILEYSRGIHEKYKEECLNERAYQFFSHPASVGEKLQ